MANKTQSEVELKINDVESDELLQQMVANGQIEPYGIYVTPDIEGGSSGGSDSLNNLAKKDLLFQYNSSNKYSFSGSTIPLKRIDYSNYDFILMEVYQFSSNATSIYHKEHILCELKKTQTYQGSVSIYSERKARLVILRAVFGADGITLSGLDANPYGTTNTALASTDTFYAGNIWGISLGGTEVSGGESSGGTGQIILRRWTD